MSQASANSLYKAACFSTFRTTLLGSCSGALYAIAIMIQNIHLNGAGVPDTLRVYLYSTLAGIATDSLAITVVFVIKTPLTTGEHPTRRIIKTVFSILDCALLVLPITLLMLALKASDLPDAPIPDLNILNAAWLLLPLMACSAIDTAITIVCLHNKGDNITIAVQGCITGGLVAILSLIGALSFIFGPPLP